MPVVAALAAGGPESDELRALIVGPRGDGPAGAGAAAGEVVASTAASNGAGDRPAGATDRPAGAGDRPAGAADRPAGATDRSAVAAATSAVAAGTPATPSTNGTTQPKPGLWTVTGGAASRHGRRPLDADEIARATYLVEVCGGREWTAVRAKANLDAALGALERVRLSAIPHRDLADIAVFVVERES
jgi:hypothetical protein